MHKGRGRVGAFPCDHYPWCIGPHCPWSPPDIGPPPPLLQALPWPHSDMGHGTLQAIAATDIWWSVLETCSGLFTWGPPTSSMELTSSGYWRNRYVRHRRAVTFYRNAFLFRCIFVKIYSFRIRRGIEKSHGRICFYLHYTSRGDVCIYVIVTTGVQIAIFW